MGKTAIIISAAVAVLSVSIGIAAWYWILSRLMAC